MRDHLASVFMSERKTPRSTTYRDEIADRIWLTRRAIGLEPKQMADLLGVALNTYSQWEATKTPSWPEMINLAERLNISLDWIVLGKESALPQGLYQRIKELQKGVKDITAARAASRKAGRPKKNVRTAGWDVG